MSTAIPDPVPPAASVPPAETPGLRGLTSLAVGVVVIAALYFGKDVLIPITLAVLLSFVLAPLVQLLRRGHLGRFPSVIISVLMAVCVILALGGLIGTQFAQLATDLPRYQTTIRDKIEAVRGLTLGRLSDSLGRLGREVQRASEGTPQERAASAANPEQKPPIPVEVHQPQPSPMEITRRILSPIVGPLETAGIILIVAIFILTHKEDLRDRLIRLFGSNDLHRTTVAMDDAARRLSRYFLAQLGLNAAFGVLITVGLWIIGIPSPVLWGVIAALMRFVPYIGAVVAAVIPVALAAAVDPGWSSLLWTVGLFLVTEPLMGHVIEPMVYGHSTGLSPVSVIIAAIFWAWLWGPIGLILSTPLTLCLVVLGRHVERLEFLDVMLGDRPALTPVENFYQRILAGDPDEAQDHAELLLKERSLSSYYDEVALKGLQLAANDLSRGVLTMPQLHRLKSAAEELIVELDSHPDRDPVPVEVEAQGPADAASAAERKLPRQPAPAENLPESSELTPEWRSANPILCVAGRGPLDEAASRMLSQLLGKHGIAARVLPHEAVSRHAIERLQADQVALICVSYIEIRGNPSHLRNLLRRLRRRFPGAKLMVGLWPAEEAALSDPAIRALIGADFYVSSLREAVSTCLQTAQAASKTEEPVPDAQGPQVQSAAKTTTPEPALAAPAVA